MPDDRVSSGDLVGFRLNDNYVLCVPSFDEPIAEVEDHISHLRASSKDVDIQSFSRRSLFTIQGENGEGTEIIFGSVIQLIHYATGLTVAATESIDQGYVAQRDKKTRKLEDLEGRKTEKLVCVNLVKPVRTNRLTVQNLNLSDKWFVRSKFKWREDGDPVRAYDFVQLQNVEYKHLSLSLFSSETDGDQMIGLTGAPENHTNMQLILGRKTIPFYARTEALLSEEERRQVLLEMESVIFSGDYLRVVDPEFRSHLITRVDDERELQSSVFPLGATARKHLRDKRAVNGVFMRGFNAQQPLRQYDFTASFTCLGVWQILSVNSYSDSVLHGPLTYGSPIRLRHTITGQFLSIRKLEDGDTAILKSCACCEKDGLVVPSSEMMLEDEEEEEGDSVSDDEEHLEESALDPDEALFTLEIMKASIDNLRKGEMLTKDTPFLELEFLKGSSTGTQSTDTVGWTATTSTTKRMGNYAGWNFQSKSETLQLKVSKADLQYGRIRLKVMDSRTLYSDYVLGAGAGFLPELFSMADVYTEHRSFLTVDLIGPEDESAGAVTFTLSVKLNDDLAGILREAQQDSKSIGSTSSETESPPEELIQWVVATSSVPDDSTVFCLRPMDKAENLNVDQMVHDKDRLFMEHVQSTMYMVMGKKGESVLGGLFDYRSDFPLMPSSPEALSVKPVWHLERAATEEVEEILFCARMLPVIRAATVALQLTPSCDLLYQPLFRHLRTTLDTLALWVLQYFQSGAVLCSISNPQVKKRKAVVRQVEVKNEAEGDDQEESDDEQDDDDDDGEEEESGTDNEDEDDMPEEDEFEEYEEAKSQTVDDVDKPMVKNTIANVFQPVEEDEPSISTELSQLIDVKQSSKKDEDEAKKSHQQQEFRSSLAPWLGRIVETGAEQAEKNEASALSKLTNRLCGEAYELQLPMNEVMLRRQNMLLDSFFLQSIILFLDVFFLQYRVPRTEENEVEKPDFPPIMVLLNEQAQQFIKMCVYSNRRIALRLMSCSGTFLSMLSQNIAGLSSPVDEVLRFASEDAEAFYERDDFDHLLQDRETEQKKASERILQVGSIIVDSVSSTDIGQIVGQLDDLRMRSDPKSIQIMKLLSALCAGPAQYHFQSLLIKAITDFEQLTPDVLEKSRPSALQENSLLFYTRYNEDTEQWQVKFRGPFCQSIVNVKSPEQLSIHRAKETASLKMLFDQYNANDDEEEEGDDILDVEETFLLLEDLGMGGSSLYQEVRQLTGSNIWGFLNWWAWRGSFFYSTASTAHTNLSPMKVMEAIGVPLTTEVLLSHMRRATVDEDLDHQYVDLISERIHGFRFRFPERNDALRVSALNKTYRQLARSLSQINRSRKLKPLSEATEWTDIMSVLRYDSHDRAWFRGCLELLFHCTKTRNTYTQSIVSSLLPAECLLSLLEQEIAFEDRKLVCNLLVSVFVDHEFVFPTSFAPALDVSGKLYCDSLNSKARNLALNSGTLFNELSRTRFGTAGALTAANLRTALFLFLQKELERLSLRSEMLEQALYKESLLLLVQKLLSCGFFNYQDFWSTADNMYPLTSSKHSLSLVEYGVEDEIQFENEHQKVNAIKTGIEGLRSILAKKLRDNIEIRGKERVINDYCIHDESSKALVGRRRFRKKARKNFDETRKNAVKFKALFSDRVNCRVIRTVVCIINKIMNIEQLLRLQQFGTFLLDAQREVSVRALEDESSGVGILRDSNILKKTVGAVDTKELIDQHFGALNDIKYVESLFNAALYADQRLRRITFLVLVRDLSTGLDIAPILSATEFFRDSRESEILRLVMLHADLFARIGDRLADNSFPPRLFVVTSLNYCYNTVMKWVEQMKVMEDLDDYLLPEFFLFPVPCPSGEDDFFEIDFHNFQQDAEAISWILQIFSAEHQLLASLETPLSALLIDGLLSPCIIIINTLRRLLGTEKPCWESLYQNQRLLINILCQFLAEVFDDTTSERFQQQLAELILLELTPYFVDSTGVMLLIGKFVRLKKIHDKVHKKILASVIKRVDKIINSEIPGEVADFFSAVLLYGEESCVSLTAKYFFKNVPRFLKMLVAEDEFCVACESKETFPFLRLVSACLRAKTVIVSHNEKEELKEYLFPVDIQAALDSKIVPLQAKTELLHISIHLYSAQEVPVERFLLDDLRRLRIFYSLKNQHKQHLAMLGCVKSFIFDGVLKCVRQRMVVSINVDMEESLAKLVEEVQFGYHPLAQSLITDLAKIDQTNGLREELIRLLKEDLTQDADKNMSEYESVDIPLSTFHCLSLVLNVVRSSNGLVFSHLTMREQRILLATCCFASTFLTKCQHLLILPPENESDDFSEMADRFEELWRRMLKILAEGLVEEFLSKQVMKELCDQSQKQILALTNKFPAPKSKLQSAGIYSDPEKAKMLASMEVSTSLSLGELHSSNLYKFLQQKLAGAQKFLGNDGDKIFLVGKQASARSRHFLNKFTNYTDFDLWLEGGGLYLTAMFDHLRTSIKPDSRDLILLQVLGELLHHNMEDLREAANISLNTKSKLFLIETKRLSKLQQAMCKLGATDLTLAVLGRSYNTTDEFYLMEYAPAALSLASRVISWQEKFCVDMVLRSIENNILNEKPPEDKCILGLKRIILKCFTFFSVNKSYRHVEPEELIKMLRILPHLFSFVANFCTGDNKKALVLFSAQQTNVDKRYVNLIKDLSSLSNALLQSITGSLVYLQSPIFYENSAPFIWEGKDNKKRRFFAWHDPNNSLPNIALHLHLMGRIFDNLISMANEVTALSLAPAVSKYPDLFEFLGVMQLTTYSNGRDKVLSLSKSKVGVKWDLSDPVMQYYTMKKQMETLKNIDQIKADLLEELSTIQDALTKWNKGRPIEILPYRWKRRKIFLRNFGVSVKLVNQLLSNTQLKGLNFLHTFFEVSGVVETKAICTKFHTGILIQDMDNVFKSIQKSPNAFLRDNRASTAVSYLSLLEEISIHARDTQDLLQTWEAESLKRGYNWQQTFGSVEIINKSGRLQRLHFPVPSFITKFWLYPEVIKMKDRIVLEVNRESPDEKILDFFSQMKRIIKVIKRQERLRKFLTFPAHALLGGKQFFEFWFIPNIRLQALILVFFLNLFYAYFTSLTPDIAENMLYIDYFINWRYRNDFIEFLRTAHFGLTATNAVRSVLNSSAGDAYDTKIQKTTGKQGSFWSNIFSFIIIRFQKAWAVLQDTLWPLVLAGLAALGFQGRPWFYVPCLLDIIFQVKFMGFLLVAVSDNLTKIGLTMTLTIVILYCFSVIAFLYFKDQYEFDGHAGCTNVIACFKLHVDYGLPNYPDWGDRYIDPDLGLQDMPYGQMATRLVGTLFTLVYIILINLVLQAIVSGLIIDTFSAKREQDERIRQDIMDKCFICSIARDDFEQAGLSFDTHIKEEHNMWHYVWFKLYLEFKDPLSYTSLESYASQKLKDRRAFVRLMPIKRSVALESVLGKDEEEKLEEKLKSIQGVLEHLSRSQRDSMDMIRLTNRSLSKTKKLE